MSEGSSRLATDLEAAAAAAADPFQAACLRADLAAQWTRLGRVDEAEALLSGLRDQFRHLPHPHLTPWLNFAESMIDLRRNRLPEATLKMRRAHALAVAAHVDPLAARAAASLALMHWKSQEVEAAVRWVKESLARAAKADHRSRCAASLLLGEMLGVSGEAAAGRDWLARCRNYASATGDTASKSALNLSISVVALANLRQRTYELADASTNHAGAATQRFASLALDELYALPVDEGRASLQAAQLHSLTNKPELAVLAYADFERTGLASGLRQRALWSADQAWCEMRLGNVDTALAKAAHAVANLGQVSHLDDLDNLAVTHSTLALVYEHTGDEAKFARHRQEATQCWSRYRAFQRRTAELCLAISPDD